MKGLLCVCHDKMALPYSTLLGRNPWKGYCLVVRSDEAVPCYDADLESFLTLRRIGAPKLDWRRHKLGSTQHKQGPHANFVLPEALGAPCRCNGNASLSREYRAYRSGRVIHLRCGDTVGKVNPRIFDTESAPS